MIAIEKDYLEMTEKTVRDFIFHCQYEKNLSKKTLSAYETDLKQFLAFTISLNKVTKDIDKEVIKAYIQSISKMKPKTIKRKIASLKAMLNFIEFENDNYINPFKKIKVKIKEPFNLPTVMNFEEVKKMMQVMYNSPKYVKCPTTYAEKALVRNIAIIELLFATGIRVSELCDLECNNIDTRTGYVKVCGKGSKERIIQICQKEVLGILRKYEALFQPSTFFFINRLGNKTSAQSVRLLIKRYSKLSGIHKNITPHTFRHTFATLLLEEDVDIKYIQNLLGHSSIAITQIYTHINSQKQKKILSAKHPRRKLNFQISR